MPRIKVNDTQLFFDVYGSQLSINSDSVAYKPTLLVLHGGHGVVDHTLYVEFWSQFSDIAQVIFLDQRGCGRSDTESLDKCNLRHWGKDVYDFCNTLDIKKPIIAGVSMGGHVMCEYISHFPEHPEALIFCNTEAKMNLDAMVEKFTQLGGEAIGEICRQTYMSPTPELVQAYREKCIPYYAKNAYSSQEIQRCISHIEVFENYCKHEMLTFDYSAVVEKIQCPTLFMVGEESPGHPPKTAEVMADRVEQRFRHYHVFKDAGAPVYKDSPQEAERVVREFILRLNDLNDN